MDTAISSPSDRNVVDDDPPPDREVPVANLESGGLIEEGQATDQVPSSLWSGVDIDVLRPHMLRIASEVLTGKQLEVFLAWIGGESVGHIAERLDVSHQVVSKHLHGQRQNGAHYGGAVKKLRERLLVDDEFLIDVAVSKAARTIPDPGAIVREWFKGLRHQTLHHFMPRAVLLVLLYGADAKRTLSFSDAYAMLPPAAVSHAMPLLKALGYVQTDGVTIRIRKTPIEERQ